MGNDMTAARKARVVNAKTKARKLEAKKARMAHARVSRVKTAPKKKAVEDGEKK